MYELMIYYELPGQLIEHCMKELSETKKFKQEFLSYENPKD